MPLDLNGPILNIAGQVNRATRADIYSTDQTPKVTLLVAGTEIRDLQTYSITSDVLSLGDPFSATIPSVDGQYAGKLKIGDSVKFFMADPKVNGGASTQQLTGLVVGRTASTDNGQGSTIQLTGADLGHHLQTNCGPVFYNLRGVRFSTLVNKLVLDPSLKWGFQGVRAGDAANAYNRSLKQGRAGITQSQFGNDFANILPRIQFEPGQTIADVLILYAQRIGCLVNVSADGYLQLYKAKYNTPPDYTFELYKSSDPNRKRNNIKSATLSEVIDGLFTEVTCVGQSIEVPPTGTKDPNPGSIVRKFNNLGTLPFTRRASFSDGERVSGDMCSTRAKWKWQRGIFDSWKYEIEVPGHSQNGKFYAPDTICSVKDTVNGIDGQFYIQSVTFTRSMGPSGGTKTKLLIRKQGFLSA